MSTRIAISHNSHYYYDRFVTMGPHLIRLKPTPYGHSTLFAYSLKISPENHQIHWQQDPFGNSIARCSFKEPTNHLFVNVELLLEISPINPFNFFIDSAVMKMPFQYEPHLYESLKPYLKTEPLSKAMMEWLQLFKNPPLSVVDFLVFINQTHCQNIDYIPREEPGVQSVEETLHLKAGSCRDTAWLLIQTLRNLNFAARFTSGYLVQLKNEEPDSVPEDFVELHAWAEVYLPGAGWIGLDPTSGFLTAEYHIPLCATPEVKDAAPITGSTEFCETRAEYTFSVQRLKQDEPEEFPYTPHQWNAIQQVGNTVDKALQKLNVELTQGGEPTFLSKENFSNLEWQTGALGEEKLKKAWELSHQLQNRFCGKGIVQLTQGKWYPGENAPRWAIQIIWRKDKKTLWSSPELLSKTLKGSYTLKDAERFIQHFTSQLGLPNEAFYPVYEDEISDLWIEQHSFASLQRSFQELHPVGFILPLVWNFSEEHWNSPRWNLNAEKLFLLAGTTAIGYRLPLSQLKKLPNTEKPERSLFEELPPLPDMNAQQPLASISSIEYSWQRTALCVSIHEGSLHVFLPPLSYAEHFLMLLNLLEKTAESLQYSIVLEGYPAPTDPRLQVFSITPDPGVVEINMHPAHHVEELENTLKTIYQEADLLQLTPSKYLIDGKPIGTGGGHHIVLGASHPHKSPFLKYPHLLKSFILFFQNHPSLSYLFSGLFVGPTSQAPRIDEAREDSLYELNIALEKIPSTLTESHYWMVDRLLRNLLVDLTGNTHRAEICIDKLYSPHQHQGRLGLVEFRAFEMPSHWKMAYLEHILLRALAAAFLKKPYSSELIPWGHQLHDRFMLPYYLQQDFKTVLSFLNDANFHFSKEWFYPFIEARFPLIGETQIEGMDIQLHYALDLWNVLGEQSDGTQTSRPVDASTERLQIKVDHFDPQKYCITCNQYRIPLQKTHHPAEYIAGIRFKARQLPLCLHPTLKPLHELVFDIIHIKDQRSVGGFRYLVQSEGGRQYLLAPIHDKDAESRRKEHFTVHGHSQGILNPLEPKLHLEYPCTLDLRAC